MTSAAGARRQALAAGQAPFAIVLGCSDSRVPAEIAFDHSLGDLFMIPVAGNIVAPSQVESVEFAAARYGVRLVVVRGHTNCGAVCATIEELTLDDLPLHKSRRPAPPRALGAIVGRVRATIRVSTSPLRSGSPILEQLIRNDGLVVVGAEYALDTGVVDFFDGTVGL